MCYVGVLIQDIGKTGKDAYFNSGFTTQFLLNTNGNVDKASRKFLNLLAVPDTVIFDKVKGLADACIILGASSFGIVCWPVTPVICESQRNFRLCIGPGDKHKLITIDNVDQYLCQGTKVLAPAANKDKDENGRPKGIRISKDDTTACGYLLHCCKHGLPPLESC